jgi:hypothetical protein
MSILPKAIAVTAIFNFLDSHEDVSLPVKTDYGGILSALCRDIAVDPSSLYICKVDSSGWNIDISPESMHSESDIGVADIVNNDILSVNKRGTPIGPRKLLKSLLKGANSNQIIEIQRKCCGWRPVKGDGNCYYRAVYFSLFEQIIVRKQQAEGFKFVHEIFSQVKLTDDFEREEHESLLDTLLDASGS